jgi:hypothetical protein
MRLFLSKIFILIKIMIDTRLWIKNIGTNIIKSTV